MSLTKSEHGTRRLLLRKFETRGFSVRVRVTEGTGDGSRVRSPHQGGGVCPVCCPAAFAVEVIKAPRVVVCAGHYWHPIARLFRVVGSLFLSERGGCLPQKGGAKGPSGKVSSVQFSAGRGKRV